MDEYDFRSFQKAGQKSRWPYLVFQPKLVALPVVEFNASWYDLPRVWYCAWAMVRCTGGFPLQVFGVGGGLPTVLPMCPLCHAVGIDIQHLLRDCTQVSDLLQAWHRDAGFLKLLPWSSLQIELFSERASLHGGVRTTSPVTYVGQALQRFAKALQRQTSCRNL